MAPPEGSIAVRRRLRPADGFSPVLPGLRGAGGVLVLLSADCLAFLTAGTLLGCVVQRTPLSAPLSTGITPSSLLLDLSLPFGFLSFYLASVGRYTTRIPFWTELQSVVSASLFAVGIEAAVGLAAGDLAERLPAIAAIILASGLAIICNHIVKFLLSSSRSWPLAAVVIGDEGRAADVRAALLADRSLAYHVVGTVEPSALTPEPGLAHLSQILKRHHADCLLIATDHTREQRTIIEAALREQVPFATVILPGFRCRMTRLLGQDTMLLSHANGLASPLARFLKAAFDVATAAGILLIASPLLALIAILVRADGGPALFAHRRLGAGGRHFQCLKFRTMVTDAEQVLEQVLASDPERAAEWRSTQKLRDDPRVTRMGRFLRRTSLDELPQLINVLRLEMSLVGPRPIVDSEVAFYGADIRLYYAIRPGLTGLWQVSGRSDTSYARRVQFDVWYVNNWTLWCDIAVLLKTIPVVARRRGAR